MKMKLKMFAKPALVLGIAGALALSSMTPSQARIRPWVAAGIGLAAGTVFGAAAANTRARYYYGPSYYGPGYEAYAYDPYYAPAPVYVVPDYAAPYYSTGDGYDSNYIGPQHERQLKGTDF